MNQVFLRGVATNFDCKGSQPGWLLIAMGPHSSHSVLSCLLFFSVILRNDEAQVQAAAAAPAVTTAASAAADAAASAGSAGPACPAPRAQTAFSGQRRPATLSASECTECADVG